MSHPIDAARLRWQAARQAALQAREEERRALSDLVALSFGAAAGEWLIEEDEGQGWTLRLQEAAPLSEYVPPAAPAAPVDRESIDTPLVATQSIPPAAPAIERVEEALQPEIEPVTQREESASPLPEKAQPLATEDDLASLPLPPLTSPLALERAREGSPAEPADALEALFARRDPGARVPEVPRRENRYLTETSDLHSRAKRLARTLISDIVSSRPDEHRDALASGADALRTAFSDDVEEARAEFMRQIDTDLDSADALFRDALNDVLAHGEPVFS